MRPEGLEPPTAWFEARNSIQLSYGRLRPAILTPAVPHAKSLGFGPGSNLFSPAIPDASASLLSLAKVLMSHADPLLPSLTLLISAIIGERESIAPTDIRTCAGL